MVWKNLSLHGLAIANRRNPTDAERRLRGAMLRNKFPHFKRQQIIGNYIVDFVFMGDGLIIELDGSRHYEEKGLADDAVRTAYLESKGFRVLRFDNQMVIKETEGVLGIILHVLNRKKNFPRQQ